MQAKFIHLRLHSEYSLVDGIVKVKPLINAVADLGMPAVAITDQSNLFSLVKFYRSALAKGVKPIAGADVYIFNPDDPAQPFQLTLLAKNNVGYIALTELISIAYQEGQHQGVPMIKLEWLEQNYEGLIALSGAMQGDIGRAILAGDLKQAKKYAQYWLALFPQSFYLELQRIGKKEEENYIAKAVELAIELGLPVVATNHVCFLKAENFEAHEVRVCINQGRVIDDSRRPKDYTNQQYLRSIDEMQELFSDIPEALDNTVEIAKRCNISLTLGENFLPDFPVPEGMSLDEFFIEESKKGLDKRLEKYPAVGSGTPEENRKAYDDRLKLELDTIVQMGFPGYFMIVADFIQWAKDNLIPVGPGRGSGAGSLVAYVLDITDLDPIEFDLLFERFLNPERVSMPDFDVDFCMDGRDRVIAYVSEHYGKEAVSQIITFGTMAAKAVVRDVARVQGKAYGLADRLSKMIPFEIGMTLTKAIDQEPTLKEFIEEDEGAQEIWEMAVQLEGITRNVGKHAGGVVIAPSKLTDFSALYCDEEGGGLVTQFDKNDVEDAGLVKFDFLGLRTLTIIDWALKMVNPRLLKEGKEPVDIDHIPLDDAASFALLKSAQTTAVFQLESRGMKDLVRRLQPDDLEDMIALVALFRPGPLESGMVDDFINRKHGRAEVAYPHPDFQHESLTPVLEPTYGVIVYQEQVMQIAQVLAGYTLGGADMLRRAMGKKKPEEMAKQRETFREGAISINVDPDLAMKIFDLVEKFAGYGFNKSHSAAYALVSYQTLWLKTHFPSEFMAAVMSADMQNTDKIVTLVEECRHMKLSLVLPDINVSKFTFTVDDELQVVYGLGAIKGLGEGPVSSLLEARDEGGPFKNLFDFCDRVDLKKVNKRALDSLVRGGAMDKIGPSRARMMETIGEAVKRAGQNARNQSVGIIDLFGEVVPDDSEDVYQGSENVREWSEKERLNFEKDTLGLYLTGHPFDQYEKEVRQFSPNAIANLKSSRSKTTIVGLIVDIRVMKNKRGQTMCFVTLDDRSGRIEGMLFADTYDDCREAIVKDTIVAIEGVAKIDDYSGLMKLRVSNVRSLLEARSGFADRLEVSLDQNQFENGFVNSLKGVIEPYKNGACKVALRYKRPEAETLIELGSEWRVKPADELMDDLKYLLGNEKVRLVY